MKKSPDPFFELDIPGFGHVRLEHLVSDFTGTLSVDGRLLPGVRERLNRISDFLKIHILTADTFGMAKAELEGVACEIHILKGEDHDVQKESYVEQIGAEHAIAFGNGSNDRKMLKAAKIGVAVCLDEGCAVDALKAADIFVTSITGGLELLFEPKRIKATLRF
ncbi:MAG: HAD hydrolase family protein [Nitrospirae bacterium]|nr:HAD hydrolase family protein [Nitrospirota bacterium]